jgi:hypothetical protein
VRQYPLVKTQADTRAYGLTTTTTTTSLNRTIATIKSS